MLLKFIFGYSKVSITGYYPEAFLNEIKDMQGIWSVKKAQSDRIIFCCSFSAFKAVAEIAKKSGLNIDVLSKHGLLHFLSKYKKRYGLFLGMTLFLLLIFISTKFVWDIRIVGNDEIPATQIEKTLSELGFERGTYINKGDIDRLQNEFLLSEQRISFIAINMKGTVANIEIKERLIPPQMTDEETPRNIVAKSDGIIIRADVISGGCQIEPGQTVAKGELLISSFRSTRKEGEIFSAAKGTVYAKTYRNCSIELPQTYTVKQVMGEKTVNTLEVFGKKIPLGINFDKGLSKYEKEISQEYISLFGITLPAKIISEKYIYYETYNKTHTKESAQEYINSYFDSWIKNDLSLCKISNKNIEIENRNGKYFGKCFAQCIEDIGIEVPFAIE